MKCARVKVITFASCVLAMGVACTSNGIAGFDLGAAAGVWLFDDGDGNVAADLTGNGNDGEIVGVPQWVDGRFGDALDLDGASYVSVDEPVGLPVKWDPRTVVLWFKWAEVAWTDPGIELMGWGQHLGGARFGVWLDGEEALGVEIAGVPKGPMWAFPWVGDTEWHHFAAALPEGELTKSSALKLYFDGEPIEGETFGRAVTILNTTAAPLTIGVLPVVLGFFFKGTIDEVAIFPWELTPENIAAIAASGLEVAQAVSPSGKLATSWGTMKAR